MSFNEDDELVSIIERGFNPLKSGQCLSILISKYKGLEMAKKKGFNPLKSGQCLSIKQRKQYYSLSERFQSP